MESHGCHVMIAGTVQGVGYRAWFASQARQLGLTGWVRNRRDLRVEALVAGPADAVASLVARAHDGPPGARVTDVVVAAGPGAAFDTFEIRATV